MFDPLTLDALEGVDHLVSRPSGRSAAEAARLHRLEDRRAFAEIARFRECFARARRRGAR